MTDKWNERTAGLITTLGCIFLIAFSAPIIAPHMRTTLFHLCVLTQIVIWALFIVHYAVSLFLAKERKKFIRANIFGLLAVALPLLEPLRAIRALALVVVMAKQRGLSRRRSLITTTALVAVATWFFAGLAVTEAERNAAERTIHNVGDGLWWAITTMATVGYGDTYPVTMGGRAIGAILMIMSIALIGTMTATIASYFTEIYGSSPKTYSKSAAATLNETLQLRQEIASLKAQVAQFESGKSSDS